MKHLSVLVPQGQNNLSSIVGPYKIFSRANAIFEQAGKDKVFQIELVGTGEKVDFYNGLFTVNTQKHISQVKKTDLIIIPSLNHNYEDAIRGNEPLIYWLNEQYKSGTEIASICTGAFLLASTGVLDGKSCSTHWAAAENFKKMFPQEIQEWAMTPHPLPRPLMPSFGRRGGGAAEALVGGGKTNGGLVT